MKKELTHPMSLLTFNRFVVQGMLDDGLTRAERKETWKNTKFKGFFTKDEWESEADRMKYSGIVFIDKHIYLFCDGKIYFAGGILGNFTYNFKRLLELKGPELTQKHFLKLFIDMPQDYIMSTPGDESLATEIFQLSKIV